MDHPRNWIALLLVKGLGPVRWAVLAEKLGGPQQILGASVQTLTGLGAPADLARNIASFNDWDEVDQALEVLEDCGGRVVTIDDSEYPEPLKRIHDAPRLIFVKGEILPEDDLSLAVVGTRKPGGYGKRITRKLAFQIASSGVTVVSGLALGVDAEAHKGAMDAKGRTLAVLGSGLDYISPTSHRNLAEQVAGVGAVITEFLPGTQPHPGNFPRRNRIIAGIAAACLVVAMPERSGAGITAQCALDQNKEVMVVPGPIDDAAFAGSHRWIRQGARPVFDTMDILENLVPEAALQMGKNKGILVEAKKGGQGEKLPPEKAKVVDALDMEPQHIDVITEKVGLTIDQVSTILLELELMNLVVQQPGKLFRLN